MTEFKFDTTLVHVSHVSPGVDVGSELHNAGTCSPLCMPSYMGQSGVTLFLLLTSGIEEPEVDYLLTHEFLSLR